MPTRSQRHLREFQGYDSSGASGGAGGDGPHIDEIIPPDGGIGGILSIQVMGTGFNANCVIEMDGTPVTTEFTSNTELRSDLDMDVYLDPTMVEVTVRDTVTTDESNSVDFEVWDEFDFSTPTLSPNGAVAGTQIQLDVYLGSFVDGHTTVVVDGVDQTTIFVNTVQVSVNPFTVPAAGAHTVWVKRGTKASQSAQFTAT